MNPLVIIVDDTDLTRLQYDNVNRAWAKSHNDSGTFFNDSYHYTQFKRTGLVAFQFNGTKVSLYGTATQEDVNAGTGIRCTLNSSIDLPILSQTVANRHKICESPSLEDATHTLEVSLSSGGYKLDYFIYEIPTNSSHDPVPLNSSNPHVLVNTGRAELFTMSEGWVEPTDTESFDGNYLKTTISGAFTTFHFQGVSVQAFGTVDDVDIGGIGYSASYQLDGVSRTSISSSTLSSGSHIRLFSSPSLENANHSATLTYQTGDLPLQLDYLVYGVASPCNLIQQLRSPAGTSETSCGTTSISQPPSATVDSTSVPSSSKIPVGSVVGAVVGGLLALCLVTFISYVLYSRRHGSKRLGTKGVLLTPESTVSPFMQSKPQLEFLPVAGAAMSGTKRSKNSFNPTARSLNDSTDLHPPPYVDDRTSRERAKIEH